MTSASVHLTGPAEDTRHGYGPTLNALRGAVARSADLWRHIAKPDAPAPGLAWTAAETAAWGENCRAEWSDHRYRVRLVELRGRWAYTVLTSADGYEATCLMTGADRQLPNGGFEGRLTRKLALRDDAIVVVNSAKRAGESSRVWMLRGTLIPPSRAAARASCG